MDISQTEDFQERLFALMKDAAKGSETDVIIVFFCSQDGKVMEQPVLGYHDGDTKQMGFAFFNSYSKDDIEKLINMAGKFCFTDNNGSSSNSQ